MAHEEVLDDYLAWELCKQRGLQEKIIEGCSDAEKVSEILDNVKREYREKDYDRMEKVDKLRELDSNPDYRSEIFEDCSWVKETVKVEELGTTLPRAGDLPPEVISGSLSEVVKFVKNADPEEYRSVKYINNLKEWHQVLDEFLPWVVTPGKRPGKRKRMNQVHGEKAWDIADTWGMINDGNHRTIAKVLVGDLKEIECYVGRR